MPEKQEAAPAAETQQDVANASETTAEAAGTASGELSQDDLEAVAGGAITRPTSNQGIDYGGGNHRYLTHDRKQTDRRQNPRR